MSDTYSSSDETEYDDDSTDEEKDQRQTLRSSRRERRDGRESNLFKNEEHEYFSKEMTPMVAEEATPKELCSRPIRDLGFSKLEVFTAVEVASVLEELSDKLNVISNSINTPPIDVRQERSVTSDMTLHRPQLHVPAVPDPRRDSYQQEKWLLTQHYSSVIPRRIRQGVERPESVIRKDLTHLLRLHGIKKFTEKGKIQADRTEAQVAIDLAVAELIQNFSFEQFVDAVAEKGAVYENMADLVETSSVNANRMTQLKLDSTQVRRDKVSALAAMDRAIYGLHDGTQEMIRRKELESAYVRKCGSASVKSSQKMLDKHEKGVDTELADMKLTVVEEIRRHESMDKIIRAKFAETEERLDYWMEKYETDKDTLQNELDTMKADRERDLKRIAWLKHTIYNYSQICRDDRRIKAKMAEEQRLHILKIKKTIKIQAWWRGEMVRKQLGPFRPTKPGKKKKGGKGKKGKK